MIKFMQLVLMCCCTMTSICMGNQVSLYWRTGPMGAKKSYCLNQIADTSAQQGKLVIVGQHKFIPGNTIFDRNGNSTVVNFKFGNDGIVEPFVEYISSIPFNDQRKHNGIVILLDEIMFCSKDNNENKVTEFIEFIQNHTCKLFEKANITVYFFGLKMNCFQKPFATTGVLQKFIPSQNITEMCADCDYCGEHIASNTIRCCNGKVQNSGEVFVVNGSNEDYLYLSVCNDCLPLLRNEELMIKAFMQNANEKHREEVRRYFNKFPM